MPFDQMVLLKFGQHRSNSASGNCRQNSWNESRIFARPKRPQSVRFQVHSAQHNATWLSTVTIGVDAIPKRHWGQKKSIQVGRAGLDFDARRIELEIRVFARLRECIGDTSFPAREAAVFFDRQEHMRWAAAVDDEDRPLAGCLPGATRVLIELPARKRGDRLGLYSMHIRFYIFSRAGQIQLISGFACPDGVTRSTPIFSTY